MYKLIASFLQSDEMIIFDQHIIELLFFFMFWIPLLASFQKNILQMGRDLQILKKSYRKKKLKTIEVTTDYHLKYSFFKYSYRSLCISLRPRGNGFDWTTCKSLETMSTISTNKHMLENITFKDFNWLTNRS